MKIFLLMSLMIPAIANCATGLTYIKGAYDKKEDSTISSKITVDLTKKGQLIDKSFYGAHVDSYSQLPDKALVDELQLGKMRIGGNEFDVMNWKLGKSINAKGEIIDIPSLDTYAKALSNYKVSGVFQINLTGFQPELEGSSYIIKRTFSSKSAYELIKYLNGKLDLKISDVSLGNEFSIWNETHSKIWPTTDGITADEYIDRYVEYALAIRKAQDEVNGKPNSIKIWGPEISTSWYDWNTGNFSEDCAWTDVKAQVACTYGGGKYTHFIPYFFYRLKAAERDLKINPRGYKLVDYLSIHYYPNFRTKIADPDSIIVDQNGRQMVSEMLEATRVFNDPAYLNNYDISSVKNISPNILGRMKEWMKAYPNVKLAINEFAVDSDYRTTKYHPVVRPLYLADSIGIFAKEGVAFLNQFLLSSSSDSNLPWSMIRGGERENLFYTYKIFSNFFLGTVVDVSDNMGDEVNAYATLQDNRVNLAVVNKSPESKKVQIYVKEALTKKLVTFAIPGWSTSIIRFDKNPGVFTKSFDIYEYGASEMGIPLDLNYAKKKLPMSSLKDFIDVKTVDFFESMLNYFSDSRVL